ncbi:hypothetical protein RclHR1_04660004 [Rhizophagus clarus]|uniref:BTB domain-containing protein n=1 Tax=Rhizophagus clarus TaxID=94130 RepID=A0A2Z6RK30_9GLOM|nr:hypothetical protein RclHR1_04660004 [Rhizophagus clarus]GES81646.1 hypothetical protein GLOIN_2v1768302 [Rhizophagus clarus]
MTSFFYPKLSKDFSLILDDADDYNVIIKVGENENTKEFRAHSVVLRARSPYFKSALSSSWITKKNDMIMFNKPNIKPNGFDIILRYIYTGELNLEEQMNEDILRLLIASDELLLEELVKFLQEYLIKHRQNWVHKNLVFILNTVCNLISCSILQNHCFETICFNPELLITSDDFLKLDKDVLYSLLERDDLLIKEIVAWDYLIKWCIEQIPGLGSVNCDRNKWNNEDYEALKGMLSKFIPLIRFTEITPNDFNNKIRPYKDIIPKQIYEEIENYYYRDTILTTLISSPRIGKIDSKIIEPKLAKIIINWIDKNDYFTFRYKFDLVYRGSIDGINVETFKNKCNGQVESLVLIKVKGSNKIYGGYSSIGFNSIGNNVPSFSGSKNSKYYYSSDNFIFSFENSDDTQDMKISRVINYDKAIYDYYTVGFDFGFNSLFMHYNKFLYVNNDDNNYENNLNTRKIYDIEEIETFIITKQ